MTPEYTSVYKYWPTEYEKAPMIVTGFRARRLQEETPEQQKLSERYEFLYNTAGEWPQRAFYGVLLEAKNGRFVFKDLERPEMRHTFVYLTPALFKTMAPKVQGGSEIAEWTEDELQNYYHQSLIFPYWEELGRQGAVEETAASVGDIHQWRDGYDHQKQPDGSWKRLGRTQPGTRPDEFGPEPGSRRPEVDKDEREAILANAYSQNPTRRVKGYELGHIAPKSGKWRDKAIGVPEDTNEANLIKGTDEYTAKRKRLHKLISDDVLGRVKSVPPGETPVAVLMMGVPASGKSSSLDEVTKGRSRNMAHIDSDLVKEALPEYREAVKQRARNAASLAHTESAQVAEQVREEASEQRKNFVFHGVRGDPEYYREFMEDLNKKGYEVNVVYMWMPDVDESKRRADRRAEITGRRVPHRVIDDASRVVTPNFKGIEDLAAKAYVYDARSTRPKIAWKRDGDQIDATDREFSDALGKVHMSSSESRDSGSRKGSVEARKGPPAVSMDEVLQDMLDGYEHAERVLDDLEKAGSKFGSDEGIIMGLGDERPGDSYPLRKAKKNRSR